MKENIYILLPVHTRRDITQRFIKCLKLQTYQNYHLLLIDDGSTDGTEDIVRSIIPAVTVLKGTGDWWWAGSLQQGYKWLKSQKIPLSDVIFITNDDTVFESDFFEEGINLLKRQKKTLLLAQCFSRQTQQLLDAGVHVDWRRLTFGQAATPEQINCLSTRGLFLRVSDFFEIGGFYPALLPHYLSDYEFTIRAQRKGMKLITDPLLRLWLDEDATGYHQFEDKPFVNFLKKYFSKKSTANPLVWTAFIALACPWPWKFINWLRIWKGAACRISNSILILIKSPINKLI